VIDTPLPRNTKRNGFSLLEILLSLAILGGSLAIIAQIADSGVSAAREARDLSLARILCQAKLSEVLLNATLGQTPQPVFDASAEPFDSQSQTVFTYTIEIQPASLDGMLMIRVSTVAATSQGKQIASYSLDRWLIDPAIGLVEAEMEEEAAKEEAAGTATETT
jgi:prepilin-type N-terminal cleavage/methylation domain-containing protein